MENDNNKKYILIAEDDQFYVNIYKVKLPKEGYEVQIAQDGQTAMNMARENKPALMLLDLMMPIMDGFEVLKELKADEALKDVPVVVMSNLGQEEDIEKAKGLGASDYPLKQAHHYKRFLKK